jgi:hypothetical protein
VRRYQQRSSLQIKKTGTIAIPWIEEKPVLVRFVYPDKRCARCVSVALVARTVSRSGRNEIATLLHNLAGPGI